MNPWLLQLINQGLIHGPKIPQYAQNVARGGEKVVQGGINTLNRYANPVLNKIFNSGINVPLRYFDKGVSKATKAPSALSAAGTAYGVERYADDLPTLIEEAGYFSGADDASKFITGEGESGFLEDIGLFDAAGALIDKITGNNSKDKKEDKEDKKDKKKKKETKKNKEPSIDGLPLDAEEAKKKKNLKKGGYVKKQRKRKPYKSSSFAKMKKSKKRKYI